VLLWKKKSKLSKDELLKLRKDAKISRKERLKKKIALRKPLHQQVIKNFVKPILLREKYPNSLAIIKNSQKQESKSQKQESK